MDSRKVEQVLKEIFSRYGVEIVRDRGRFEGAVSDLLDERKYTEERAVIRRASESKALWVLLKAKSITDEGAENVVTCLEKENRMTREDAVFVVRCVVSVMGENPDIVKSQKPGGSMGRILDSANDAGKKNTNQGVSNRNTASGTNTRDTSVCLLEAPCKMGRNNNNQYQQLKRKGKLYLYSDRLEFIPERKGEQMRLDYQDITKVWDYTILNGVFTILYILAFIVCCVVELEVTLLTIPIFFGLWLIPFSMCYPLLKIKTCFENEMGYKIFYEIRFLGAHKKRTTEIIKKGMKGQL